MHIAKVCTWLSERHQLTVQSDREALPTSSSMYTADKWTAQALINVLLVPQLLVLVLYTLVSRLWHSSLPADAAA